MATHQENSLAHAVHNLLGMKPETAITWNKAYCWAMVVFYVLLASACFTATSAIDLVKSSMAESGYDISRNDIAFSYQFIGYYALLMAGMNIGLLFVPRTKAWWLAHLINHAAGVIKCCCIPIAVPMLVMWLRKDVQALFDEGYE